MSPGCSLPCLKLRLTVPAGRTRFSNPAPVPKTCRQSEAHRVPLTVKACEAQGVYTSPRSASASQEGGGSTDNVSKPASQIAPQPPVPLDGANHKPIPCWGHGGSVPELLCRPCVVITPRPIISTGHHLNTPRRHLHRGGSCSFPSPSTCSKTGRPPSPCS